MILMQLTKITINMPLKLIEQLCQDQYKCSNRKKHVHTLRLPYLVYTRTWTQSLINNVCTWTHSLINNVCTWTQSLINNVCTNRGEDIHIYKYKAKGSNVTLLAENPPRTISHVHVLSKTPELLGKHEKGQLQFSGTRFLPLKNIVQVRNLGMRTL